MATSPGLPRLQSQSLGGAGRRKRIEGQRGREGWGGAEEWQERDGSRTEGRREESRSWSGSGERKPLVRSGARAREKGMEGKGAGGGQEQGDEQQDRGTERAEESRRKDRQMEQHGQGEGAGQRGR